MARKPKQSNNNVNAKPSAFKTIENKKARLARHLKKHPNDEITRKALKALEHKTELNKSKPKIKGLNKHTRDPFAFPVLKFSYNFKRYRPKITIPSSRLSKVEE